MGGGLTKGKHRISPLTPSSLSLSLYPQSALSKLSSSLSCFHNIRKKLFSSPKLSDYEIGEVIGKGGFGIIRKLYCKKDDRLYALKMYKLSHVTMKEAILIVNELKALSHLPSHPFIVNLHATFRDHLTISFVLDFFPGGDLRLLLLLGEKFSEQKAAYLIGCIGSALHHIHLHHIIHRDVKPENIMFDRCGVPKLVDFGISYVAPAAKTCVCNSKSGTDRYVSPETSVPGTHYHGYESDFWSLGVIMFEILFLSRPYDSEKFRLMVQYSQTTYVSVWSLLVHNSCSHSTFLNSTDSQLTQASQTLSSIQSDQMISPLSSELLVVVPDYTFLGAHTTPECRNLILSLLDVRIQKRLGVGVNYSIFANHPFFTLNGISISNLTKYLSPISPEFEKVSNALWCNFFHLNLLGYHNPQSSEFSLPHDVAEYLQQIRSIARFYHEL